MEKLVVINSELNGGCRMQEDSIESLKKRLIENACRLPEDGLVEGRDYKKVYYIYNENVAIEYDPAKKEITGSDLTDMHNEPRFFTRNVRSLKKAWAQIEAMFTTETKIGKVLDIFRDCKVNYHYYCALD